MTIVKFSDQGYRPSIAYGGARHEGSQGTGLSSGIDVFDGGAICVLTAILPDGSFAKSWQGIPVEDIPRLVKPLMTVHHRNRVRQRLTQGIILQASRDVGLLLSALFDARQRYVSCRTLRPGALDPLARQLKRMTTLPHTTDYTAHEANLKRQIVRARHRIHGYKANPNAHRYALSHMLPPVYNHHLERCDKALTRLLKLLADVPLEGQASATPKSQTADT